MEWKNPKVTLPLVGRIYMVIFDHEGEKWIGMCTTRHPRRFDKEKDARVTVESELLFQSIYGNTRTRAARVNGERSKEYKDRVGNSWYYYTESMPSDYPVERALAYIAVEDMDYPNFTKCGCND